MFDFRRFGVVGLVTGIKFMFRLIPSELNVVTLGQLHRYGNMSVRVRVPLRGVDFLISQPLMSFDALRAKTRVSHVWNHAMNTFRRRVILPASFSEAQPCSRFSSAGTLESWHSPAESKDGGAIDT